MNTDNLKEVSKVYDKMLIDLEIKSTRLDDVYKEIKELDETDKCTISEAVCKFAEESGEWIREINKTTGRKCLKETPEELRELLLEEAADTLQNHLLICGRFGFTIEELLEAVKTKNKKWKSVIPDRQSAKEEISKRNKQRK